MHDIEIDIQEAVWMKMLTSLIKNKGPLRKRGKRLFLWPHTTAPLEFFTTKLYNTIIIQTLWQIKMSTISNDEEIPPILELTCDISFSFYLSH